MGKKIQPTHPGLILKEEFLDPLGIKPGSFAVMIDVDRSRINKICKGERDMTADTSLRLAKALGTSAQFWMTLQAHYDLETARDKIDPKVIKSIKTIDAQVTA